MDKNAIFLYILANGIIMSRLFLLTICALALVSCQEKTIITGSWDMAPALRTLAETEESFVLACARHFFAVSTVKKVIDILALHRLNDLSEDQGWCLEIKKYPLLTEDTGTRYRLRAEVERGRSLPK